MCIRDRDWGKEQMFIFYTEDSNILSACICAMVAVGQLVCIFTGRELPRWLHTLKYIALFICFLYPDVCLISDFFCF